MMESDALAVNENGKNATNIEPAKQVVGFEEATDTIGACMVAESSDNDFASTTSNIVGDLTKATIDVIASADEIPVIEPLRKEEGKLFFDKEDICTHELSIATEADEDNTQKETGSTIISALDIGETSKSICVEGRNEVEREGNITLESDLKVATTAGFQTSVTVPDPASVVAPSDNSIDTDPMPYPLNFECDKEINMATHEKPEASQASHHRKGLQSNSTYNKTSSGTAANDPMSHNQQKMLLRSTYSDQQISSSMNLSSLPIDSLHNIASFLIPIEWKYFGQCDKATNKICKEIFRRVRMHGFRCATEVIMAWKFGQHADARELCALYVSAGVPIYPHSLGHSYHTLVWKLSIEAKHLQEEREQQEEKTKNGSSSITNTIGESVVSNMPSHTGRSPIDPSAGPSAVLDPFFNERDDFRMREDLTDGLGEGSLTYLEEKALYNLSAKDNKSERDILARSNWRRTSIEQAHRRARNPVPGGLLRPQGLPQAPYIPPPLPFEVAGVSLPRNRWSSAAGIGRGTSHRRALTRSNSFSGNRYRAPNISVKIHRHLLDQHLLGRSGVKDFDGLMSTPPVSLSSDFFHPFFSLRSSEETVRYQNSGFQNSGSSVAGVSSLLPAYQQFPLAPTEQIENDGSHENFRDRSVARQSRSSNYSDDSDSDIETEIVFPRSGVVELPSLNNVDEMMAAEATLQPSAMVPPMHSTAFANSNRQAILASAGNIPEIHMVSYQTTGQNDILSNIDLDVYSASRSLKADNNNVIERRLDKYLKARFTVYHCCLERHLLKSNNSDDFEETIMDFWDEFLPQTANIQYYDKHTAVPRISRLEKFLTKPCPKQIGIVQCEIERVKLNPKKKGVNMKGRFFPTYEYRLFIRHRPSEPSFDFIDTTSDCKNGRRDTVLMMAKNRGRKHSDNTGQTPKKGSNNYYLSLPQQGDLDVHYKNVNALDDLLEASPNGVGTQPGSSEFAGLLGRLQSNFVGTEFQIFTPRRTIKKTKAQLFPGNPVAIPHVLKSGVNSDDEILYDSGRQSELNPISSRPRSRFGRLSLRGRSGSNGDNIADLSEPFQPKPYPLTLRRSRSSDASHRRNRRVSAAESFFESQHFKAETQSTFFEEEDGAITYTANLLGSRPRIMDVCIPKVNPNGIGTEWRRYLEDCKDQDAGSSVDRLLNHLKQLQQNSQLEEYGRIVNPANNDADLLGSDNQEYSPPGDFGLLALQNRPPWWNVELGSFVLNFGGRVSVASVKNFQLCDRNDQDHIMLQFGRIEGRHSFTMDFQYPLTAVQAFAIAISSLQSKISFG